MAPEVKLSVRLTDENRERLRVESWQLYGMVACGALSYDEAAKRMAGLNEHLTEDRTNDGPWKPLAEA